MIHYSYGKFTLQAVKARAKLAEQLEEWEWFVNFNEPDDHFSDAKNTMIKMNQILRTVDPTDKQDIKDVIEDLDEENKVKLAELLGLKYNPIYIGEFQEDDWE